jgi:hypothetical protein
MSFDPNKPLNDLPLLQPKAELETKAVLRKAIAANKALAELMEMLARRMYCRHMANKRFTSMSRRGYSSCGRLASIE